MFDIPEGDCDCDGNQSRLGVTEVTAQRTSPTASVTTKTTAWANSMLAAYATVR